MVNGFVSVTRLINMLKETVIGEGFNVAYGDGGIFVVGVDVHITCRD